MKNTALDGAKITGRRRDTEFLVVSYDVLNDRRRNRVHKLLTGYGQWVQYSVFECYLTKRQQVDLFGRLERLIDENEDKVRVYHLCGACEDRVTVIGGKKPSEAIAYFT
ncbi:MAG: CRISPR-associated endonuclease Cas2 [Chloroflexi bacterium]|nr:CRISPR-associated endonuclease Cas2 [Chloroflexota bacterium]